MAIHRKILRWLETELFEGNIQLGQSLPDDQRIAHAIGVGRSRTRDALKTLEDMELMRLYSGRGKEIIPYLYEEPAAAAAGPIRLHMSTSRYPTRDMLQTRILLESWAVSNIDPDKVSFDEVDEALETLQDDTLSIGEFLDQLLTFHHRLVRLAGNELVVGLLVAIRQSSFDSLLSLMGRLPLWSSTMTRIRVENRAIVDAVKDGDARTARELIAHQLQELYSEAGIELDQAANTPNGMPGDPSEDDEEFQEEEYSEESTDSSEEPESDADVEEHEEAEPEQDTDENIPESEYKAEQEKSPAAQLPKIIREGTTVSRRRQGRVRVPAPVAVGFEEDEVEETASAESTGDIPTADASEQQETVESTHESPIDPLEETAAHEPQLESVQPEFEDDVLPVEKPGESVSDEAQDKESAEKITAEKATDESADGSENPSLRKRHRANRRTTLPLTKTRPKSPTIKTLKRHPTKKNLFGKSMSRRLRWVKFPPKSLWRPVLFRGAPWDSRLRAEPQPRPKLRGRTMLFVRPCAETCRPCDPRNSRRASPKSQRKRRSPRASASA